MPRDQLLGILYKLVDLVFKGGTRDQFCKYEPVNSHLPPIFDL